MLRQSLARARAARSGTNRVQRRHNTSPFPQRPGYGFGAWVPPGLIAGMKKEANVRSKILVYDQIMTDLESTQRELLLEKNQITNNFSDAQPLPPMMMKTSLRPTLKLRSRINTKLP